MPDAKNQAANRHSGELDRLDMQVTAPMARSV
jgi:hypothetical protein